MGYPNHRLSGINPLAYLGVNPVTPPLLVILKRDPTQNDSNFDLGSLWINEVAESIFMLVSLSGNIATWAQLFPHPGTGSNFVTDSGTAVETAGSINVFGDGVNISTSASPPNTIHITMSSSPTFNGLVVNGNATITGNLLLGGTPTFSILGQGIVQSSSSGVLSSSEGTDGQLLIGSSIGAPAWANITSTNGTVVITNGHNTIDLAVSSTITKVTTFNTSGTWTKGASTQYIQIIGWNGGAGGGSGARGLSTMASGGGGGAAGGCFRYSMPASFFPSSVSVTIGAGGTGGATQTVDNTNGNKGTLPGFSSFGDILVPIPADTSINGFSPNGYGGVRAASTDVVIGGFGNAIITDAFVGGFIITDAFHFSTIPKTSGNGGSFNLGSGGFGTFGAGGGGTPLGNNVIPTGSPENPYNNFYLTAGHGGAGGGADTGIIRSGGLGSNVQNLANTVLLAGGTAGIESGTIDGGNGNPSTTTIIITGGTGGGGGGGQSAGLVAGNGGNGAFPGGAGGGGGGSLNGTNSGTGGNGAAGQVIVIEFV